MCLHYVFVFFFKQKTAYEMRISDGSSDVCSSDLIQRLNWEVYNCQDLMQVAAASLLAWAISLLNSADGGLSIHEIRDQVVDYLTSQSEMGFDGSWSDFRSGFDSENYDFREPWNQQIGRASCRERGCQYV